MSSCVKRKSLPPAEMLPGGVFPDDIAVIKKKARGQNASRPKIGIATGSLILVIFAVVGGPFLQPAVATRSVKDTSKIQDAFIRAIEDEILQETVEVDKEGDNRDMKTRSVKLAIQDEIVEETVAVDKERDTETFRTVSSTGTSFVIMDMKTRLSAYRFDGDQKCYILYESLEEAEDTAELLEDLEKMEEGEVDAAERRAEMSLTVDEARGPVDQSVLSENMAEFCEGLQAYWAVRSDTEPTPTQQATTEEEEDEMELEALPGTNGINAVQKREKRVAQVQRGLAQVVGGAVCYWKTKNVCGRTCSKVCGKRRRRGLVDGAPEQEVKTRAKRGWIRRTVRRVVSAVCRNVCSWRCRAVRVKVCSAVG